VTAGSTTIIERGNDAPLAGIIGLEIFKDLRYQSIIMARLLGFDPSQRITTTMDPEPSTNRFP